MPLTITADTKFITDYLDQVGKRIDDPAPLLDQIGMLMETRISNRFETMTDPGGTKWAPWAESTKANYPDDGHGRLLDRETAWGVLRVFRIESDAPDIR